METTWGLVCFAWATLIAVTVALFIREYRKSPEQKTREKELAQERYEREKLSRKIVEVSYLGVTGSQFKRGGMGGAMFGGFFGGFPGAIVGAMLHTGKRVLLCSFAVKYGNNKVDVRECVQGSSEYKALMKYVHEWEECKTSRLR